MNKFTKNKKSGFTLIEIMVSIGIFSTVMLIGIGALLSVNDANRKARALRVIIDNLNFALEDMSRKIRIGGDFYCVDNYDPDNATTRPGAYTTGATRDCSSGGNALVFKFKKSRGSQYEDRVIYYFRRSGVKNRIESRTRSTNPASSGVSIFEDVGSYYVTSPEEIQIDNFKFYVVGTNSGTRQPRITISLSGKIDLKSEKVNTAFSIQTTVSQRRAGGS